ncbi:SDR family oxidoreductase [Paraburkholderia panacisoli]|uniref:SDR family oxidoreductase n=1 Tax=Paraburkholderia panacisoli TaxID=2603818 RepID=A0A5B0G179_9BURK|nr:SDR family oxidoreductase [Paraburkholderia panacisoli]KAA0997327.1 SDR family oxidoreductase [Paraburkholderia panacisoli]
MKSLRGKTALVTGADCTVGRAIALSLARAGAQVLVQYTSSELEADAVVFEIRSAGGRAEKLAVDLREPDGPHRLARRALDIIGARLDVLVSNTGVGKEANIEDTTVEDFDNLFAANVRGPYFLVQQLMPAMCKNSNVIFVSALVSHTSTGALSANTATRGAIGTLVKHFAATLGVRGVRVNAVAPGMVETDISKLINSEAGRAATRGLQALTRVATPEDVGAAVVFLASDAARWITGGTLKVDGGLKL